MYTTKTYLASVLGFMLLMLVLILFALMAFIGAAYSFSCVKFGVTLAEIALKSW